MLPEIENILRSHIKINQRLIYDHPTLNGDFFFYLDIKYHGVF